jgi:fatty-acyl-CoA synthase
MNRFLDPILHRMTHEAERPVCTLFGARQHEAITWGDLGRLTARFVALYRQCRVEPGATLLIFLGHSVELYAAFLGAMRCGAIPSMMPLLTSRQNPALFWRSHAELLHRLSPVFLVLTAATAEQMLAGGLDLHDAHLVTVEELPTHGTDTAATPPETGIAALQHSSGTTGLKKGVALSFAAIIHQLENYASALTLSETDEIVSWLPLYHDMGFVACFLLPLYFGCKIQHIDPLHWVTRPATLLDALNGRAGTLVWMPNFGFEHLTRTTRDPQRYDLSGVKAFINCSEPCRPDGFDRFLQRFQPAGVRESQLQCCYAMAENTFAVTQTPIGHPPHRIRVDPNRLGAGERPVDPEGTLQLIDTGFAIDGVETIVVDFGRHPISDGIVGEIAVRGTSLFSGYHLDQSRTAQRLSDGTYYTGDLGLRHEGRLYVLGRLDDLIIVNGRNLFAHEIEAALTDVTGVKPGRSLALSLDNPLSGSRELILIAERDGDRAHDDDVVRGEIVSVIESIFGVVPRDVVLQAPGWLVKTTSGKINRSANLARYLAQRDQELC